MKDIETFCHKEPIEFVGALVRLAFHESGTYSPPNKSGPDGCLLENANVNRGLKGVIQILETLRQEKYSTISRSDFWIFSASHALDLASQTTGKSWNLRLVDNFRWGRKDRKICTSDAGKLPGPTLNAKELADVFQKRMGFTARHMVALMGGHSVGRFGSPRGGASFDSTPDIFDNIYYQELLNLQWKRTAFHGFRLWKSNKNTVAFHTDILLGHNVGEINHTCEINTKFNPCPIETETRVWVRLFANNLSEFYKAFGSAWAGLHELGYNFGELKPITYN